MNSQPLTRCDGREAPPRASREGLSAGLLPGAGSEAPSRTSVGEPRIVVPTPYFSPAYKAGGAQKSVHQLVAALSSEFALDVHCLDVDIDAERLDLPGPCREIDHARIHYHDRREVAATDIRHWLDGAGLIYLNSFFEPVFSLKVAMVRRASRRLRQIPLLIAPRGEVFDDTLAIKALKKRVGVSGIRLAGLYSDALWHASTDQEVGAIEKMARRLGQKEPKIFSACDIAAADVVEQEPPSREVPHLVFFARISPKKNLDFALRVLAKVQAPVRFDIYGPIEDAAYWRKCEELMAAVPPRHQVHYRGVIPPGAVESTLARHDLYFFPTRSENFGHTIQEAMAAGLPALLSDQTPWRGLETAGAGWDLPLSGEAFAQAIDRFCRMDHPGRLAMRASARRVSGWFGARDSVDAHRNMFVEILSRGA
jgi:glycosyltransferase involved in cell wall biosynthesis